MKKAFEVALMLTAADKASRVINELVGNATKKMKKLDDVSSSAFDVGRKSAMFGAGLVAAMALPIKAAADMESINIALKSSFQGNEKAAKQAFSTISKFAANTPFEMEEVTSSFIKLKNSGLDPSAKALEAYGNIASSLPGKTLKDFTEAVTDAVMGENERLKEFNISAHKHGQLIDYTFRGVTTTVKNNAKDIEKYLQYIGNVKFAGATVAQSRSFNGMMSTMRDNIKMAAADLGNQLLPDLKEFAQSVSQGASDVGKWIIRNKSLVGTILKITAGLAAFSFLVSGLSFLLGGLATAYKAVVFMKKQYILFQNSQILSQIRLNAVIWYTVAAEKAAAASQWLMNASLYGCPIVWIVAGIMAVIAVVWLMVKYWKPISAFFGKVWVEIKAIFWKAVAFMKDWGILFLGPVGWVIKAFQLLPDKFKNIGADILTGLWNGLKSKASQLFSYVKNIGQGIANSFKAVLGIASPSKVFMDYGVNITEGAHNGIKKGESKVIGASAGMGRGITPSINSRSSTGGGSSNVTVNFAPVISGASGDVAGQLKQLIPELVRQIESKLSRKRDLAY